MATIHYSPGGLHFILSVEPDSILEPLAPISCGSEARAEDGRLHIRIFAHNAPARKLLAQWVVEGTIEADWWARHELRFAASDEETYTYAEHLLVWLRYTLFILDVSPYKTWTKEFDDLMRTQGSQVAAHYAARVFRIHSLEKRERAIARYVEPDPLKLGKYRDILVQPLVAVTTDQKGQCTNGA